MNVLLQGFSGLLSSRKGTFSLLIFMVASAALFFGKLPGAYYAAVIATVSGIYNYCQHKCDIAGTSSNPSSTATIENAATELINNVRGSITTPPVNGDVA